jgi:hypothetical protein
MPQSNPLALGTAKQLLFDDALIEAKEGFTTTMNPAMRSNTPVLTSEKSWERHGCSCPTVMLDEGIYKMWYTANGEDGVARECYATSTDGIHWERPNLGLIDYQGSRNNNIIPLRHETIFKDPSAEPERRFKSISGGGKYDYVAVYGGGARFRYDENPPETWHYGSVAGAYSPDGIHWTACEKLLMPWYTDTRNVAFWDDRIQKYVAYVRWNEYLRAEDGAQRGSFDYRAIARSESTDFENFPVPEKILEPDFDDPEDADMWGGGLYDTAAVKYPLADDAYFIFTAAYYHTTDALDIQLATSRDGIHFTRWREPFVRLGPTDAFDSMMIYMGVGMLPMPTGRASSPRGIGDELWMYYGGFDQPHDKVTGEDYCPAIGCARLRLDGFVSQDAAGTPLNPPASGGNEGGWLTTLPFTCEGSHLEVNMDGSARGWLKVEILDEGMQPLEGFTEAEADRLGGSSTSQTVTWGDKRDLSALKGQTVRLRFVGQSVKLYAFQLQ